jgi:hypothetical protein
MHVNGWQKIRVKKKVAVAKCNLAPWQVREPPAAVSSCFFLETRPPRGERSTLS